MLNGIKPRLLPTLIGLSVAIVGYRGVDMATRLTGASTVEPVRTARAADAEPQQSAAEPKTDAAPADAPPETKSDAPEAKEPEKKSTAMKRRAPDDGFSPAEVELLQNLSKRREELDARDAGIAAREATLKIAEERVGQKLTELNSLKSELEKLLQVQTKQQDEQVMSLVKIYSDMKPADAARIFNTLDMKVLLTVVSRMKEQKAAPIIAGMQADRARELTTRLAEMRQLPQTEKPAPAAPAAVPAGDAAKASNASAG